MTFKTRVLVLDDSEDIALLHKLLIDHEDDMECVGMLCCADQIEAAVAENHPEVVVLDLNMPGRNPLDAVRGLAQEYPGVRVLVCSGFDDADTMDVLFEAGAWGLVSKHSAGGEMLNAIRAVARGETWFHKTQMASSW